MKSAWALLLLAVVSLSVYAQSSDVEYGKPNELKGLKKVFIDTGADMKNRERIISEQNKIREARRFINDELRTGLEDEADARELTALNERLQILTDSERPRDQLIKTVESFIALIKKYLEDPVAEEILKGEVEEGGIILADYDGKGDVLTVKVKKTKASSKEKG